MTNIELESLELTYRTYNCLRRAGINSLLDLSSRSDDELKRIRNLGRKSFEEIQEKLAEHGLKDSSFEKMHILADLGNAIKYLAFANTNLTKRSDVNKDIKEELKEMTQRLNEIMFDFRK